MTARLGQQGATTGVHTHNTQIKSPQEQQQQQQQQKEAGGGGPAAAVMTLYRALYPFVARNAEELSLEAGCLIEVADADALAQQRRDL